GPKGVPEKSTKKTRSRGTIRQTRFPLESRTREQPSLKQTSNSSSRSYETESRLKPRFETKATSLRVKRSETLTAPTPHTLPLPLSPNMMYSLWRVGVRLENHLSFLVIWREQPESMIYLFSKPPTCTSVVKQRVSKCLNTGVSKV